MGTSILTSFSEIPWTRIKEHWRVSLKTSILTSFSEMYLRDEGQGWGGSHFHTN